MKKIFALLFVFLLIFPASSQFENYVEKRIKAVAVVSGENRGATIDITVIVTPGNGRVFVSVSPFTEIDMQGSAQLAALTACDLTGEDFLKHDFFYIIESDAPIVGGPSAGGVMTVATIAALKNLSLRDDVFMTGMIYPDGSIGPVGGIPYKLEAAAESGAKIFLIPKGQRFVYVEVTKKIQKGPFIFVTTRTKKVDVVAYGRDLGVKVIEVENVNDALRYYAGVELKREISQPTVQKYSDLLKKLADNMRRDAESLYKEFEKIADWKTKEEVDDKIKTAEDYYSKGYYYSATSMFFTAKIIMRDEIYSKTIKNEKDFSSEAEFIEEEIKYLENSIKEYKLGLVSFQIVGAAQERLAKAKSYLEKARMSESFGESLSYLALARERVESAKSWLSLLKEIKKDCPISEEELKRRCNFYLSMSKSLYIYANSIGGSGDLLNLAGESLNLAEDLYDNGYYAGSILSSIDSMVKSAVSIELIGVKSAEELADKIEDARDSAKNAIGSAEKISTPILAYSYYEFAETSEGVYKMIYYKLSERIAKTIISLAGRENVRIVNVSYEIPEIPITPKVKSIVEEYVPEIPGFSATLTIAILSSLILLRRRWR